MFRALRLRAVIALVTITAVLPGCAANRTSIMPEKEPLFRVPKNAQADSTEFLELSAVIYTIDSVYWDYIRGAPNLKRFRDRISKHQESHPQDWLTALEGLKWGKDSAHCQGNPWQFDLDARWRYFIRFGPPSAYWSPMYEVAIPGSRGRVDTTQTFFNWWSVPDTGIVAQVFKAEWYPPESSLVFPRIETIVGDTIRSKFGKSLYPKMDIATFPNEDSTFDVGISSSIAGDRLTKETILKRRQLEVELQVFSDDTLVFEGHQTQKLGLGGLILSVTANKEDLGFAQHFTISNPPKGRYEAEVTIEGDRNNTGKVSEEFAVPSVFADEGMSDILLVNAFPVVGEDVLPGIRRRHNRNLYGRGSTAFNVGDTLSPYVEITFPKVKPDTNPDTSNWSYLENDSSAVYFSGPVQDPTAWSYTLSVVLDPVRRRAIQSDEKYELVFHDSLGNPILKWAGVDFREKHRQLKREKKKKGTSLDKTGLEMLFARTGQLEGNSYSFESAFEVKGVAPGDYWLIVAVEARNSNGNEWTPNSRKRIRIKYPEPPAFGSRF